MTIAAKRRDNPIRLPHRLAGWTSPRAGTWRVLRLADSRRYNFGGLIGRHDPKEFCPQRPAGEPKVHPITMQVYGGCYRFPYMEDESFYSVALPKFPEA